MENVFDYTESFQFYILHLHEIRLQQWYDERNKSCLEFLGSASSIKSLEGRKNIIIGINTYEQITVLTNHKLNMKQWLWKQMWSHLICILIVFLYGNSKGFVNGKKYQKLKVT